MLSAPRFCMFCRFWFISFRYIELTLFTLILELGVLVRPCTQEETIMPTLNMHRHTHWEDMLIHILTDIYTFPHSECAKFTRFLILKTSVDKRLKKYVAHKDFTGAKVVIYSQVCK